MSAADLLDKGMVAGFETAEVPVTDFYPHLDFNDRHYYQGHAERLRARGGFSLGPETVRWTLQLPEQVAYDGLAVLIHGFGATKQMSQRAQDALAENGIASVTYTPARHGEASLWQALTDPQLTHLRTLEALANHLRTHQDAISRLPNGTQVDIDKKLLLPHSMGGLVAPDYALGNTGSVHGVIELMAAGIGRLNLALIAQGAPQKAYTEGRELLSAVMGGGIDMSPRGVTRIGRHLLSNIAQTTGEGLSCLAQNKTTEISDLRAKGVPFGYLSAEFDIVVPTHPDMDDHVDVHHMMSGVGHWALMDNAPTVVNKGILPLAAELDLLVA